MDVQSCILNFLFGKYCPADLHIAVILFREPEVVSLVKAGICPFCGRRFRTRYGLKQHLARSKKFKLFIDSVDAEVKAFLNEVSTGGGKHRLAGYSFRTLASAYLFSRTVLNRESHEFNWVKNNG